MASRRSSRTLPALEDRKAACLRNTDVQDDTSGLGARFSLDLLFRNEAARLTRFFRRRLRDPEEVHDCVQETFARMAGAKPTAALANPEAYLQRIARNLAINIARRASTDPVGTASEAETLLNLSVPADQSHAIEARELYTRYRDAVDALSARTREVFLLHRIDELSYKEIAQQLGIGVRTVEYHIAKALAHIDRMLTDV